MKLFTDFCWYSEISDERHRVKVMIAEFSEREKCYDDQRRRHIAQQQRVKKEERKAAVEAQQLELYVSQCLCVCIMIIIIKGKGRV